MVFNGESSQLTSVTAVTPGYPLRGRLLVAAEPFARGRTPPPACPAPARCGRTRACWRRSARTWDRSCPSAPASFRVARVLIAKPDQGSTFAELAPSLLMNAADLAGTQLIQPGSRVSYAGLFAGERGRVDSFKTWLVANKRAGRAGARHHRGESRRCATQWIAPAASSAWRAW